MTQSTRQRVLFADVFAKPLLATFDTSSLSSDAGFLLLGAIDRKIGLTGALCAGLPDPRQPGKVEHSLHDLFRQRVYSIAAGYADGNDASGLRSDPLLQLVCDRPPGEGEDLASQPTLSRFERSMHGRALILMGRELERERIERFAMHFPHTRRVVIDLDATVDPTHGQQAFSFFNGFYDTHCFLPLLGFLSADGERQEFAYHARLRPGIGASSRGVMPLVRRTVAMLRDRLPKTKILVRMDGGFANPRLLRVLDELRVDYVLGLASNSVLLRRSKRFLRGLRKKVRDTGQAARRFGALPYAARTWDRKRRVVVKAEVLPPPATGGDGKIKTNVRFVVTNLKSSSRHVYETVYCARGNSENRIKELKNDLQMDRTSSTSYLANQFRVLATLTAYALYQELQWELRATSLASAQVATLRLKLVKLGARVEASVRRFVVRLPLACPHAKEWCYLARRLGALPG
jgi:hypothetical protein